MKNRNSQTFYQHGVIQPGFNKNNRTRFFELCRSSLGSDFESWLKNPNYRDVEKLAHTSIYGKSSATYQPRKALELQVCFLLQAPRQLKNHNSNRRYSYEQAVASAIDAGVITGDQQLSWR